MLDVTLFVLPHGARDKMSSTDLSMAMAGQNNSISKPLTRGLKVASSKLRARAMETELLAALSSYKCLSDVHGNNMTATTHCQMQIAAHLMLAHWVVHHKADLTCRARSEFDEKCDQHRAKQQPLHKWSRAVVGS